ncbi:Methyltransferase domain-containing protein [Streptomyces sp. SceaMP-e96]|uniref:class I SAM-dependent methyltransferase n=1 Tax=unclassified Streptomyces TaxID=2593676 RepID=UPI000823D801|nr:MULTISPECIES: class I SAM-dependent methyltransferase [unclassified Streptomyces]MYT13388.1 class I SAM-dependent methyltransferase [Streptomyces sp. SID4951]SCK49550.1 Methyltransferase domain-containing protein [Streptomyces sp. SceaMP-e96]
MTAPIADQSAEQLPRPTRLSEVKGWFFTADQLLFDWFLKRQQERSEPGDLLELGAYMGKSAIFLGARRRAGERFTVCDLFDSPAEDSSNSQEMKKSYATLTRRAFEANYLAFHEELPTIVQGLSSIVTDHVEEGSVRFAHIDASHLYEHVHGDILAVRELLTGHGVVVMDDYRAEHCPGVAAATWQAVANEGLRPICITGTKFYGTWGDPEPLQQALADWIKARGDIWHEVQYVNDAPLVRLSAKGAKEPAHPVSRYTSGGGRALSRPSTRAPKAAAARPGPRTPLPARSTLRRVALDVLPPVITRAVVNARRRARTR